MRLSSGRPRQCLGQKLALPSHLFDKVEKQYHTMNTLDAFRNLKVMAGDVSTSQCTRSHTLPDATDLNKFYIHFDSKDFTSTCTELLATTPPPPPPPHLPSPPLPLPSPPLPFQLPLSFLCLTPLQELTTGPLLSLPFP